MDGEAPRITILGVNAISRQLAAALEAARLGEVEVVDFHVRRNVRLFDASGGLPAEEWPARLPTPRWYDDWVETLEPQSLDCVVATSETGATSLLEEWNEFCVAHHRHYFPVVLDRSVGRVGPFVIPGETACYRCLTARAGGAFDPSESRREFSMLSRRMASSLPAKGAVVGEIAAAEVTRLYGGLLARRAGHLIHVNLPTLEIRTRKVPRLHRCPVCSRVRHRNPAR